MIYIPFSVIALNCPLKGSIKYPQAQNNSFSHAFSYLFSASRVSSPLIVELSTSTLCLWLGTLSFIGLCLFRISGAKHVLLPYPWHKAKAYSIQSTWSSQPRWNIPNPIFSQPRSEMTKCGWFKFTSQEVLRLIFHVVLWNVCVHPGLVPRRIFFFFFLVLWLYVYICSGHLSVCQSGHALKNISNATDQTLIELTGTIQVNSLLKHHCLNIPHNVWNVIFFTCFSSVVCFVSLRSAC